MRKIQIYKLAIFTICCFMASPVFVSAVDRTKPAGCTDVQIDLRCQRDAIINPSTSCNLYYCADDSTALPDDYEGEINLGLFKVAIHLDSDKAIAQLITLIFSLFLGVVALAAGGIGLVAAVKRANTESDSDVAAATKAMRNAITGLIIVGMSLLIVQLVASALGIGNIFSMVTFDNLIPGSK